MMKNFESSEWQQQRQQQMSETCLINKAIGNSHLEKGGIMGAVMILKVVLTREPSEHSYTGFHTAHK
jgi:hypothetical protein